MNKADYLAFPAVVGTTGQYNNMRKMWDGQHYKYHVDRMGKTKPMVDNKAPRTYLHCHLKLKKIQMEQERLMELERDNRLLVSRIARTMGTKGGLDNWNTYQTKHSVNADLRNRELVKESLENQAILKKIDMTKSVYDHRKWLNDFKVTRGYVNRLMKYPEPPMPTKKHRGLNLV
ncbi:sperm axonemal maintenance protein CFAP97D1-like isoform X2 [Hypomesus transpacificus]|uniref:sperm axonemal maintenance protein CFAP97D1-like isoform X2 n=1 Tax=Hypomesus transpacificus TaxID=137520 RepID=UPI001F07F946|nr:sperm axonemal maintenance protein CFAP97D1-like isoform X2 [Hypomesus transpacificus]